MVSTRFVILNFLLIPKYSYDGAAITTIISDILSLALFLYSVHKLGVLSNKKLLFDLIKIIIGSVILYISLTVLNLNMWIAIPVGIIIYIIVITLMKTFDGDDKYIIMEILGKK